MIMINKYRNERISITLSKNILKKLDKFCSEECRNRSKEIEYIIKYYLANKKEKE